MCDVENDHPLFFPGIIQIDIDTISVTAHPLLSTKFILNGRK